MRDMMDSERLIWPKLPEIEQSKLSWRFCQKMRWRKNAILEVRAGTGGEEAALFAYKLFLLCIKYAEKKTLEIWDFFQFRHWS